MAKINYLHLSDLHIGDSNQRGLISQTKSKLFEDIEFILLKIEKLDVVFFTGDLVQKGAKEEFDLLEIFLKELWLLFEKYNQNPYLLCVPGNHDLERINNPNNSIQKVMSNWVNESIKNDYFWNSPNEYIEFITARFKNYDEWYKNTSIQKPKTMCWGYLPGDFYCSINIDNAMLGIVGLNSSFLQLTNGDASQKLGIYNPQINHLFKEEYLEWLNSNDLSILLTHHSPSWFEPDSIKDYNHEIYIENSFAEHLCGHMHEPSYTKTSINGFPSKSFFTAPSLFGLEYYGDKFNIERIHGYTAGVYNIEPDKITKTVWPRISLRTKGGTLKIVQNDEFNLEKDSSSFTDVLRSRTTAFGENKEIKADLVKNIEEKEGNLFTEKTIMDKSLIRTVYKEISSHTNIRLHDRMRAAKMLKNQNLCWVITKFGLGEDEFIGAILNDANINTESCFRINCDEIASIEELINAFKTTFSYDITKFFDIINTLDRPLIVFSNFSDELVEKGGDLKEFLQTIFDFCTQLNIVVTSTNKPDNSIFEYVELFPLDVPAVKQFIEHSQNLNSSFTFLEYEKIHRISSGIPLYIDKIIEQLKFRPLSDLGEMEFEAPSSTAVDNILTKSVKNEITLLRLDENKQNNRKFLLLSILSLLHNGETYERIKRFDSTKPFHPEDVSYLLRSKLVEAIQVNSIFKEGQEDSELIKIIKVPRMIRDYISSLLDDEEKLEIYKQACNLYLGNGWRNSIKLIHCKETEHDLIIYQNLQIAIRFILSYGLEKNDKLEITRMTQVSMSLIEYFSNNGAYKDAVSLTEETLLLIKDVEIEDFEGFKTFLTKKLGENLRMSSFYEKSISILKSICGNEENSLNKKDRNDIRLSIAYAYETLGNEEEAIKYANLIKKNEDNKNSSVYLSAESVIVHFITDNTEKLKKLNTLKNKASKFKFNTLKANIILDICKTTNDKSQIKELDKVIVESKGDTYNKVRALAAKAEIVLNTKKINEINNEDLIGLNISYSYSFYQRLQSLLNKCHRLAWNYWLQQNRFDQLLNLFRYSSFVWRLCSNFNQERKYIDELYSNKSFLVWLHLNKNGINSTYYEQRIFTLYNKSNENLLN